MPSHRSLPTLLQTIRSTPIARLSNLTRHLNGEIIVKLESANPGGSLKDRAAWHILRTAERAGLLGPGSTIIESSSGNFSIALAMIGAIRGYRIIAVVDPKITPTNRGLLEAYGAEIIVVHEQDDSGSYHKTRIALANKLHSEIPNSFRPDQCFNLQNGEAHFSSTAPELAEQVGPGLRYVVCSVSTGGQIGGISRYFARHDPGVRVVGVDVHGSAIFGGPAHSYLTPGVGLSWTPDNIEDLSRLHSIYKLTDQQAYDMTRTLARHEGLLAGVSTGACTLVALTLAQQCRPGEQVACLAADRGERYLATAFDEAWLASKGLDPRWKNVEEMTRMAASLTPWSTDPVDCANYAPELAEVLGSPTAGNPLYLPADLLDGLDQEHAG
ncbi:MAG: cysteine synthase family protein [Jatrophihabitans sp.]